jgi:hypothetical protein
MAKQTDDYQRKDGYIGERHSPSSKPPHMGVPFHRPSDTPVRPSTPPSKKDARIASRGEPFPPGSSTRQP